MLSAFSRYLSEQGASDCEVLFDYPLSRLTTFSIGGPCAMLVRPETVDRLVGCVSFLTREEIPYRVIGNGSNLLADDAGYPGVILHTARLHGVQFFEDRIRAECGVFLSHLTVCAAGRGLGGLENLTGIPATLGGALYMNAGAYGTAIGDRVLSVEIYDPAMGARRTLTAEECAFSYRHSIFQERRALLLAATLSVQAGDPQELTEILRLTLAKRRLSQPLRYPSAGSVFRRPSDGSYAARRIEQAGLKGLRVGDAMVSEQHAGFIVNVGHATARDVRELIEQVSARVWETDGVRLQREIEYLGE